MTRAAKKRIISDPRILFVCMLGVIAVLLFSALRSRTQIHVLPQIPTEDWVTSESRSLMYTFRRPAVVDGPSLIHDNVAEIYEEVDGLLLFINDIPESNDPLAWIATQEHEAYSNKPYDCFEQTTVTDVPGIHDPATTIVSFDRPILMLDNITTEKRHRLACNAEPFVRVLLIPHMNKMLRITYRDNPLSEAMLATFKFEVPPNPICRPRPACWNNTPPCPLPETVDMCPQ